MQINVPDLLLPLFPTDPLQHPLINSPSFFCKHAGILINAVKDAFISVGKLGEGKWFHNINCSLVHLVSSTADLFKEINAENDWQNNVQCPP